MTISAYVPFSTLTAGQVYSTDLVTFWIVTNPASVVNLASGALVAAPTGDTQVVLFPNATVTLN